jgi:hypothetical protein
VVVVVWPQIITSSWRTMSRGPSRSPTTYAPTQQPSLTVVTDDGNTTPWLRNAFASSAGTINGVGNDLTTYYILCWVNVAVASFVLIHSFLLHGFKYSSVRVQTDVGATFSILSVVVVLEALRHPTREYWSLLFDFLFNGIFSAVVQLCDNYMFYYRLLAVKKLSLATRIFIQCYIWGLLIFTWLPEQTIVPFFVNENTESFANYFAIFLQLENWAAVAYNFSFTFYFLYVLYKVFYRPPTSPGTASPLDMLASHQVVKVVAVKSIGHCFTSSLARCVVVLHLLCRCMRLSTFAPFPSCVIRVQPLPVVPPGHQQPLLQPHPRRGHALLVRV